MKAMHTYFQIIIALGLKKEFLRFLSIREHLYIMIWGRISIEHGKTQLFVKENTGSINSDIYIENFLKQ